MPYILKRTNGITLTNIQDGSIDNTTNLTFIGKNYAGYGQAFNENFLQLLENFSGATVPSKPLSGQLWFDSTNSKLKVYDGARFKSVTVTDVTDGSRPSDLRAGDQWFDKTNQKLYVYNGVDFTMIGPEKTAAALQSTFSASIVKGIDRDHTVLQANIGTGVGSVASIFSVDSFVPSPVDNIVAEQNYSNIRKGISFADTIPVNGSIHNQVVGAQPTTLASPMLFGAAASAYGLLELDGNGNPIWYESAKYLRQEALTNLSPLVVTDDQGITIGGANVIRLSVSNGVTGNISNIKSTTLNFSVTTSTQGGDVLTPGVTLGSTVQTGLGAWTFLAPSGSTGALPVDLGTLTTYYRTGYIQTVNSTKLVGSSATNIISGTWQLEPGATINSNGNSIAATTAVTSTNATLLQSYTNNSYVHAQIDETAYSIAQRDANGRITSNGINAGTTGTSKIYGTWAIGPSASLQATSLLGAGTTGYVAASQSATVNTIAQRDSSGCLTATRIYSAYLNAGQLESSSGYITGQWQLVGGSTIEATYADIAERYEADSQYSPGTVLVIGGIKEVTLTDKAADVNVAGIVSTNPAFKLNGAAGDDVTHPYIALKGRVPCKVVGPIKKGNLLVTSQHSGYAQAYSSGDDPLAVFATALEDFEGQTGTVEVKVK
jgi:hypothetical protein